MSTGRTRTIVSGLSIGVGLAATGGVAAAEEIVTLLPEIRVVGDRVPSLGVGATELGEADLAASRARTSDTARLLTAIPGVAGYGAGGVSSLPVIRGLASDRLRTKVDGIDPVSACPNHMNPPLSYVDPTAVKSVQVYPGVAPVSLGGNSIGGSIIVESAVPVFADPGERLTQGEVGAFYRSNGNSWGGNVAATAATDSLTLRYEGAYAQSDNYKAGGDFKTYGFTGREGHTLAEDEVGSTAYEANNQAVILGWQQDGHLLDFSYRYQHIPYEAYPNQRMDMTDNRNDQFNLGYIGELGWGELKVRAYHQQTQHAMDFGDDKRFWYGPGLPPQGSGGDTAVDGAPCSPISGTRMVNGMMVGCAAGMPMETDAENTGFNVTAAIALGTDQELRIGGEYQRYRLDDWWEPSGAGMWPYTFWNINDGKRDRYAMFGEWELSRERWSHIVGLRYEAVATDAGPVHGYNRNDYPLRYMPPSGMVMDMGNQTRDAALFNAQSRDRTDHNWDFAWIARFTPDTVQDYELGIAQKTRSPNLYERYTWSTWQMAALMNNFVGDGNGYIGNLDLDPEVARTLSLAADWHDPERERWGVRVSPYYTYVQDYIDAVQWDSIKNAPRAVPVVDNFTVLKYVNQSAYLYGIDLSAHYRVASGTPVGDLTLQGIASYTRGKNDDTGDNLYNIMPLYGKLALAQQRGPWRNTLEGEFVAGKEDVSRVRNEMQTAGYGLAHLRSSYEKPTWSLEVGVENLFDRFYDLPLGGAYVGQGTTMTIPPEPNQPQWGTPVPGPGRSFYAAVNLKF